MLVVIGLMVVCGVMLVAGFVWLLAGQPREVYTPDAEEAAGILSGAGEGDDEGVEVVVAERSAFRGRAAGVRAERTVSVAEIEAAVRAGRWAEALPGLLAVAGLLGLVVLIGPLLWYVAEGWVAVLWIAAVLWMLINAGRHWARR